jgi:hypothetical protein
VVSSFVVHDFDLLPSELSVKYMTVGRVRRAGAGCLNSFSASISGASAGVRLPSGGAAA